jgi:hypothetical protein
MLFGKSVLLSLEKRTYESHVIQVSLSELYSPTEYTDTYYQGTKPCCRCVQSLGVLIGLQNRCCYRN